MQWQSGLLYKFFELTKLNSIKNWDDWVLKIINRIFVKTLFKMSKKKCFARIEISKNGGYSLEIWELFKT